MTHLATPDEEKLHETKPVEGRVDVVKLPDIVVLVEENSVAQVQAAGNRILRMTSQETLDEAKAPIAEYPAGQELEAEYRDCRQCKARLVVSGMENGKCWYV